MNGLIKFNKDLLFLPFDLYGRYRIIAELIQTIRTRDKLRILDVGGNVEVLNYSVFKKFLPNDHVIVLDKSRNNYKDYIRADALNLPFGKEEFDLVVSADVLEHIPQDKRERFLEEQLRVAKQGVVLTAPFFSKETVEAERVAAAFYKSLSNKDHRWLSEHKKFVLPDVSWFESFLMQHGLHFKKILHNYIPYWNLMICAHFYTEFNANAVKGLNQINKFYNSFVFPYDNQNPACKYVYLITKEKLPEKMGGIRSSRPDKNFLPQIQQMIFELIGRSNKSLIDKNRILAVDSLILKQILNSRKWKIISFINNIRIKIPILKNFN